MNWLVLVIAGLFEVVWALGLKYSQGFSRLVPSLVTLGAMVISIWLLSLSLKSIPLGTAYAVWTGIGIVGTVIFGIIWFAEPVTVLRLVFIMMVLGGIIGLKCC